MIWLSVTSSLRNMMTNRPSQVFRALLLLAFLLPGTQLNAYVLSASHWPTGKATVHVDFSAANPPGSNQPNIINPAKPISIQILKIK